MKKLLLLFGLVLLTHFSYSQIYDPVKWTTSVEKLSENEYNLVATATIENKWHLYSQSVPPDGPIPTNFSFSKNPNFELIGTPSEENGHTVFDPVFKMNIKYFENSAVFKQKIKKLSAGVSEIKGAVEFMVCDDAKCLPPATKKLDFDLTKSTSVKATKATTITTIVNSQSVPAAKATVDKSVKEKPAKNLLSIFLIAFFSGFAALLTPCVFPMIPMTVSYFTKKSKSKAAGIKYALVYGISIVIIYVALGFLVSLFFGANALNALSTNVWFNLFFFGLLVVFAISFLGAFEIVLPSSWSTKIDAEADRGGFIGIFFMALALAIVSFSCTGPIVGTLLVQAAAGGNQIGPIVGMLGFSLALAIPFALFAAFPGWMHSLPKSGGWLNTVKVVLGFLELALAFKFLSNADLVLQLHWLEREVFLAIWIAIFGTMALYLFGKIRLPHDSPLEYISVGRLSLGMVTLAFTIYMIPGLWGAPLNLISAFPPSQHYGESPYGVGYTKLSDNFTIGTPSELPDGAKLLPPHNIMVFNDYDKGLAYAKKINKPILIDFTGYACVNCRKMEQNVWPKEKVLQILKNEVVLISLYVDDKRPLPNGEEVNSKLNPGEKLRFIGQKWSEFETIKYKTNAQPFYVLINLNEENLITPIGYTPDADEYYNWLKKGITNFN